MKGFDEASWEWILSHNWPGNVRELKNAVERAVIMTRSETIKADDIMPRHLRRGEGTASMMVPPGATLADTRRQLVLRAFASTNGDYARTATIVGMSTSDVRSEIASLLNGSSGAAVAQRSDKAGDSEAPAGNKVAKPSAKAASAAKSKAKKR
jgi:DNA-binding NtrC family response regulator